MKSKLIALITAGAIATTGISAPAQADPAEDLARILIGAAIIGAIVNSSNNGNTYSTVTRRSHRHQPVVQPPRHRHQPVIQPPRRHHTAVNHHKPRQCMVKRHTARGWKKVYRQRCMQRLGWHRHSGLGWHQHRNRAHR